MAAETLNVRHPQYLDDDGGGSVCFLRYDFAADEREARKRIENMGFDWDWRGGYETDVIWMVPVDRDDSDGSEYYEPAPQGTPGDVRYWRFRF